RKLNISIQLACVVDEESGACSSIVVRYLLDKKLMSRLGAIYLYPVTNVIDRHGRLLRLYDTQSLIRVRAYGWVLTD
ncbi:unnamed protein product, partial [Didymodactylos carnosus]